MKHPNWIWGHALVTLLEELASAKYKDITEKGVENTFKFRE